MQMQRYKSAEQDLVRSVMNNLLQSPMMEKVNGNIYDRQQDGIGYDENMNKITPFTYIIVGESSVSKAYSSASHTEEISLTLHLYHRSGRYTTADMTRGFLTDLEHYATANPVMEYYEVERIRLINKQTIPDIDLETSHGILQLRYVVKHLTRR